MESAHEVRVAYQTLECWVIVTSTYTKDVAVGYKHYHSITQGHAYSPRQPYVETI